MEKKIGIIAGNGDFPLLTVRNAQAEGYVVSVAAIKGETSDAVMQASDHYQLIPFGQMKKVARFFLDHGVTQCLLAGKVTKTNLFKGDIIPDIAMIKIATSLRDWKDDSFLGGICEYLEKQGLTVLDSTRFLGSMLAESRVYSAKKPSKEMLADIQFGRALAKEMGRLDVGQSVVVKKKAVLAVEAIEGTDEAIKRAGVLGGKGAVVVKVAKPDQDMRFDVPVVGIKTIDSMCEAGATVLAVEARKTLILDLDAFVERINKEKLIFVGMDDQEDL